MCVYQVGKEGDALGAKRTNAKTHGMPWCLVELPPLLLPMPNGRGEPWRQSRWAGSIEPPWGLRSLPLCVWPYGQRTRLGLSFSESVAHSVLSNSLRPHGLSCQAPWPMEFSRQEYWSGLPFATPGDLPDPGIEPMSLALAGRFFTSRATSMSKKTGFPK